MTDWLLAHQEALLGNLWVGGLAVVMVLEAFLPRRAHAASLGARWLTHVALKALGTLLVRLCVPFAAFAMAVVAEQNGWGLLNLLTLPAWLACTIAVLAIDLSGYALHRVMHSVPIFWRFHQIHHSDIEMDCGTALRHHPGESLLANAFHLAVIVAVGAPPLAALIATALAGVASVFNHGNIAVSPRLDAMLRWLVVTPDMHRIHHSVLVEESNRNYSNLFPWWDRLFATYRHASVQTQEPMELGLSELRKPSELSLWKLLLLPTRRGNAPFFGEIRLSSTKPGPKWEET